VFPSHKSYFLSLGVSTDVVMMVDISEDGKITVFEAYTD